MEMLQPYGTPQPRPIVRFEMRSTELRDNDQITFADEPWVIVSAPGSRDTTERKVAEWLQSLVDHAKAGRVPPEWPEQYSGAFDAWKKTQEQPANGTSLKNWPAITPAQLKSCLSIGLTSIEEVATANEQIISRLGMGAVALKAAAQAWIKEREKVGSLAIEVQTLTNKLAEAMATIEELKKRVPDQPKKV